MTCSNTPRTELLPLVGMLCILVGYWAPWVDHPAAGLVQNGFDLCEFVKFLPQVKDGSEPMIRWLFFLPLTTVALSLSLLANGLSIGRAHWLRLLLLAAGLLLLVILIPPYPYTPDRLLGYEFRARTILAMVSWGSFLLVLTWLGRWLSRRWMSIFLAILALVGTVCPIVQFLSLHDALSAVYGRPIAIGWGVWLMVAGMVAVLGGAALRFPKAKEKATR